MESLQGKRIEWARVIKEHRESIKYLINIDSKLLNQMFEIERLKENE